jgi:hypothetical protein
MSKATLKNLKLKNIVWEEGRKAEETIARL